MGENNGATDDLIGLSGIDPEARGDFDCLVEFRERELLHELDCLVWSELDTYRHRGAGGGEALP